jgi:hypothetical protein
MSRHLELMKLHDDELEPDAARELEAELTDEELAVLEGLEQLGDVVRALADDASAPADGIADAVMERLSSAEPAPELSLLAGGAPVGRPAAREPAAAKSRAQVLLFSGLGLAAAALALLFIGSRGEPEQPARVAEPSLVTAPSSRPEPTAAEPELAAAEDEVAPAASIEAVDFGNQAGTIFLVPAGEETTPVVWLVDDAPGARMEPL